MKIHEYNEMMAYLTRPAVYRRGFFKGEQVLSEAQVKKIGAGDYDASVVAGEKIRKYY